MNYWRGLNRHIAMLVNDELNARQLTTERAAVDLNIEPAYLADWLDPETDSVVGSYGVDLLRHLDIHPFKNRDDETRLLKQWDDYLQKLWPESLLPFLTISPGRDVREHVAAVLRERLGEDFGVRYAKTISDLEAQEFFIPCSIELWNEMINGNFSNVRDNQLFSDFYSIGGFPPRSYLPLREPTPSERFELERRRKHQKSGHVCGTEIVNGRFRHIWGGSNPIHYNMDMDQLLVCGVVYNLTYFMQERFPPP